MNIKTVIWTLLTLMSPSQFGQTTKKCDSSVLLFTSEKIGKLSQTEIADFLLTFGAECRNNVEYSEWSNELLFDVLDNQTELTLQTIQKEASKIELVEILNVIASPLLEENIDDLIKKVKAAKDDMEIKVMILDRLNLARDTNKK